MLCENCKKAEANIHYSETINGQTVELHLCEECAKQKGLSGLSLQSPVAFVDLLTGFLAEKSPENGTAVEEKVKCPGCGFSGSDFKKSGLLGCAECYRTFKKVLLPLLRRIHGSTGHLGKIPSKIPARHGKSLLMESQKLRVLREKLVKAVREENFEEAAKTRDEIRKIENGNK